MAAAKAKSKKSDSGEISGNVRRGGPKAPVAFMDNEQRVDKSKDALQGHFCDVVSGDEKGTYGVFEDILSYDKKTGLPKLISVRTRRDNNIVTAQYSDCEFAESGRR